MFEVASFFHAVVPGEKAALLIAQDRLDFLRRPHEEPAFLALAVRVLGRVETAAGLHHLADHVRSRFRNDLAEQGISGGLEGLGIGPQEQRVVVEHLLEVGDQPFRVDGIAVESAAQVVVDAAVAHFRQGMDGHVEGRLPPGPEVLAQQEGQRHGRGELGLRAETAVGGVIGRGDPGEGLVEQARFQGLVA